VVRTGSGSLHGVDGVDEFHDVEWVYAELPGGGVKGCFIAKEKQVSFDFAQGRLSRDSATLRNDKFKNFLTAKVAKNGR
jgi:hypothetical protein